MRKRVTARGWGGAAPAFEERTGAGFFACFFLVALFLPASPVSADVVINEIMYNPSNGLLEAEYVELYNPGPGAVDLTTYRVDNGVEYEFPSNTLLSAGRYLAICENTNDFAVAYSGVTNVCGNYSGSLADSGERVTLSTLVTGQWVTVDTVEYNDRGAWTNAPDGDGPSLELIHPGYDNDTSESWTASTGTGTPGAQNSGYVANPAPVITDVEHDPPLPFAGAALTVRAYVFGHDTSPLTVTLRYRQDAIPALSYEQTAMLDDGMHNDELVGDGIYGAVLPGLGEDDILDFQITATDTNGPVRTAPSGAGRKFLCCFGDDPLYRGEYLTFHILLTQADRTTLETRDVWSNDLLDGTLVLSSGRIFYNCGIRFRGSSCRVWYLGPKSYRVELPPGRRISGHTDINLNACNPLLQVLGNNVFKDNGLKAPGTRLRRLWINSDLQVQTNELWLDDSQGGIYVQIDKVGDDFLNDEYPDADWGNLYRGGSSNGYTSDLSWQGTDESKYYCYRKETNDEEADWSDVIELCDLFNNTTGAAFPDALWTNINVSQWITFFATHMALNNNETCIATTGGGDYYTYHDPVPNRFDMLPWDLDSIIDLSGSSFANQPMVNKTIWNSVGPPLTNFLRHPRVAPLFVGQIIDMMDTTLSVESMTEHFDELGDVLTPDFRSKLIDSLIDRRDYVRNEVNLDLTVLVSGALTGKTTIVTGSSITLSGQGPQPWVFHILVDGARANWSPYHGDWSSNSVPVANGMNRIRIEAVNQDDHVLHALDLDVIARLSVTSESGTINSSTSWSGVIRVTGDVTVASGKTLTILPGTVVLFDAGRSLGTVGGVIDVQGTSSNKVYFMPYDAATQWGRLSVSGAGASNVIRHAELAGGQILATNNAVLLVEDSLARDYIGNIVQANNAGLITLRRSHFTGVNNVQVYQSPLLAEYCLFEDLTGDGLDCADASGVYQHTIRRCTVRNGHGGSSDGIDFEPVRHALVEDCLIYDMADRCFSISGSTNVTIRGCVLYDAVDGFGIKDNSTVTMSNCTVHGCERGVNLEDDGAGPGHGVARNLVVWENAAEIVVTNGSTLDLTYSDVRMPGAALYTGAGNINAGPLFLDIWARDLRLDVLSPCRGTGAGGTDMGAPYPVGAAPATPGALVLRNLTASEVEISWTDNSVVETAFEVERSNAFAWVRIGTVSADSTNYVDSGLTPGATYSYRVRAVNPRGESFYAGPATILASPSENTQRLIADLRITEIMYHPRDGVENGDEYEFLELKNTGTNVLDLAGAYFDNGLDFTFPAGTTVAGGDFLVLARNPAAFSNRYPGVAVAGAFTNSALNNGGERLEIEAAYGERIFDVTYDDNWHETTDGEGYSLVLVDPEWNPDQAASWRASTDLDGSPGADDPAPAYAVVVINEALAHTDNPFEDAIELYNTSPSNSVDIGGWYLSDSGSTLKKYRIPNGTTIGAADYAVFYEVQFNVDTNDPLCFALSEHGDEIYLSSANASSNLTSYRASARFGASDQSRSFGRHLCSDGEVDFVPMSNRTFGVDDPSTVSQFRTGTGQTNTYPRVGPVVINEIMYHPAEGDEEFIELHNIGSTTVSFYDVARPTNTWRLGAAVDYTFPTNVMLSADGYLLVTDVAPDLFRQKYQVPETVAIYGPWQGSLANEGESVKLHYPGVPDPGGFMSYVRMDRVKYNDKWPWPESADGAGPSLERRAGWLYGNDPTNWLAVTHAGTPGAANSDNILPFVAFVAAASLADEASGSVSVLVELTVIPTNFVTVQYGVVGGTASNGVDYALADGVLTFLAGQTNSPLDVVLNDDGLAEEDETVRIRLSAPVNARLGAFKEHELVITDMDNSFVAYNDLVWTTGEPLVNITTHGTGDSGLLKDYGSGQNAPVSVEVAAGGGVYTAQGADADAGTDAYDVFEGKIGAKGLIGAGGTNLTLRFTGMQALGIYELVLFPNQSVSSASTRYTKVVLSDVESFYNESTAGASVSTAVMRDDSTTLCNYNGAHGLVARFTHVDPGSDGDMLITISDGSSTGGLEYCANAFMLRAGSSGTLDLPMPSIQPNGATFGGTIEVTLSSPDPEALVFYTTDGLTPTVYSEHYTAPFILSGCAKVKARSFRLGYGDSDINTALFIKVLRSVTFVGESSSGREFAGLVDIPVALSLAGATNTTVGWTAAGGTASNGVDFAPSSGTLTFAAGVTNGQIRLWITDDGEIESDETVVVTLDTPSDAVLGNIPTHTYTILDDDLYVAGFVTGTGGVGLVGATVSYSGPTSGSVETDGNGSYIFFTQSGTYNVSASASGYLDSNVAQYDVPPSVGNADFALERRSLTVEPESIALSVRAGTNATRTLSIVNAGISTVNWSISTGIVGAGDYFVLDSDASGGPTYSWIEISGTGTEIHSFEDVGGDLISFPIGFSFSFYGNVFTNFRVSEHGFVTFTGLQSVSANTQLPYWGAPANILAVLWDRFDLSSTGSVFYALVDPSTLVVEYKDLQYIGQSKYATFEIVLKADGTILFQYQSAEVTTGCTVGMQNATRDKGIQLAYNQAYLHDNMAVRVSPTGWLRADPETGVVGGGQIEPVTLHVDAAALAPGTYSTILDITTDDSITTNIQVPVILTVLPEDNVWLVAYNDLAWFPGQIEANITTFTITNGTVGRQNSGYLKDYRSGVDTDVTLTLEGGGGVYENQGLHPAAGKDAYSVFNGKVNATGTASYSGADPAEDLVLTLDGLDSGLSYELVLYCDRNNTAYVGALSRDHRGTLEGAVTFQNESTLGTTMLTHSATDDTTFYNAGYNNQNGYVTRFTGIVPGGDGQVVLRLRQYKAQRWYSYANALMVRALYDAPDLSLKIGKGAVWRYRKGTAEASVSPIAWRQAGFDDSGWLLGAAPFGHGGLTYGTSLDMRYNYTTLFVRKTFLLDAPDRVSELRIRTDYDDGYIAWINGEEIAVVNMTGGPGTFHAYSDTSQYLLRGAAEDIFTLTGADVPVLLRGTNVLAIQIFNTAIDNFDSLLDAELSVIEDSTLPQVVDADRDGMPDDWEIARFGNTNQAAGADFDGDGISNLGEFIGGSYPMDGDDRFVVTVRQVGGAAQVVFTATSASGVGYDGMMRYYELEQRPCLTDGSVWNGVSGYTRIQGNNQTVTYVVPTDWIDDYYRVRLWLE